MNENLLFDFSVNKENNTISVKKEFAASVAMTWDCWTKPELLDQWWAPKPWRAETRSMDFTEGGRWHYAMIGPEGDQQGCLFDYERIDLHKSF